MADQCVGRADQHRADECGPYPCPDGSHQKGEEEKEKAEEKDLSFIFRDLEERMKQVMGTKVIINKKDKNKGRIEIEYYSEAELERIVELIESIH